MREAPERAIGRTGGWGNGGGSAAGVDFHLDLLGIDPAQRCRKNSSNHAEVDLRTFYHRMTRSLLRQCRCPAFHFPAQAGTHHFAKLVDDRVGDVTHGR